MIPFSVSDLIKLLDELPIWRAVAGLPKRLAELERKVTELEGTVKAQPPASTVPEARICQLCRQEMKVIEEKPDRVFGTMGVKVHVMECTACKSVVERQFHPAKGYQ